MQLWLPLTAALSLTLALCRPFSFSSTLVGVLLGLILTSVPLLRDVWHKLAGTPLGGGGKEVYPALDHLLLNAKVETSWLNMGYWEDTEDFPTACRADMKPNLRVLDVGCGTAQSLELWHDRYKPSSLVGITSMPSQASYAKRRLPVEVEVQCADAVDWVGRADAGAFDRILALDTAYHFTTRQRFLQRAFKRLAPGGRIALADLILADDISPRHHFLMRFVCLGAGVSFINMHTEAVYRAQLCDQGYTSLTFDDITPHVFSGLHSFLTTYPSTPELRTITSSSAWLPYRGFAKVVKWWAGGEVVRFIIVSAQRPLPSERED